MNGRTDSQLTYWPGIDDLNEPVDTCRWCGDEIWIGSHNTPAEAVHAHGCETEYDYTEVAT